MSIRKREYTSKAGVRSTRFYAVVWDPAEKKPVYSSGCSSKKEAREQELLLMEKFSGRRTILFSELVDRFAASCGPDYSPRTFSEYCYSLRSAFPALYDREIGAISAADLIAWRNSAAEKWAPETVNKRVSALAAVFSFAVRLGLLEKSPAASLKRCRVELSPRTVWTEEQVRLFLSSDRFRQHFYRVPLLVSVVSGIRPGELCGLAEEDVLPDRVVLRRGMSAAGDVTDLKTARSHRSVALPAPVLSELRRYISEKPSGAARDFLFVSKTGTPLRPDVLSREFRDLVSALRQDGLDLPVLRLYDLRHSVATNLYLSGEKSKVISELLGNAAVTMERHYAHVSETMHREALSSYFSNIAEGPLDTALDTALDTKKKAALPDDLFPFVSAALPQRARDGNRTRDLLLGKLGEIAQILQDIMAILENSKK